MCVNVPKHSRYNSSSCLYMGSEDYFILFMISDKNYIDSQFFVMHVHSLRCVNSPLNVWEYPKLAKSTSADIHHF